jgi:uncharacterized membrane protein
MVISNSYQRIIVILNYQRVMAMSKKEQRRYSQHLDSQDLDSQAADIKRRDFLRGSIVTATGVAAAVVATGSSAASVTETAVSIEPDKKEGYRLTKHIADYYKSAAV